MFHSSTPYLVLIGKIHQGSESAGLEPSVRPLGTYVSELILPTYYRNEMKCNSNSYLDQAMLTQVLA